MFMFLFGKGHGEVCIDSIWNTCHINTPIYSINCSIFSLFKVTPIWWVLSFKTNIQYNYVVCYCMMIVTCLATHSTFTFSIFNRDISHSPQTLFPQGDSLCSNAVKETDCNCYIKECLFQENLSKWFFYFAWIMWNFNLQQFKLKQYIWSSCM